MKINWQNKEIIRIKIKNKHLSSFLFEDGSLSRLIQDKFEGTFHIDLINESWITPMPYEKKVLSLRDNEISFILQKKNIIMGKTELDITDDILKIVDNEISKINFE